MADRVRARHAVEAEAARDIDRQADLLVDLDRGADAHYPKVRVDCLQSLAGGLLLAKRQLDDRMGLDHSHLHRRAQPFLERAFKARKVRLGMCRLHGDLQGARVVTINRKAGTVRPTIPHARQHWRQHRAKLWLQAPVLQKQAHDAAHGVTSSKNCMAGTLAGWLRQLN